jgi:hypothetical protein
MEIVNFLKSCLSLGKSQSKKSCALRNLNYDKFSKQVQEFAAQETYHNSLRNEVETNHYFFLSNRTLGTPYRETVEYKFLSEVFNPCPDPLLRHECRLKVLALADKVQTE